MTNQQHLITPPPNLTSKWNNLPLSTEEIFVIAARWGADQELEACCGLLQQQGFDVTEDLRAARRPKPPSLKELALELVHRIEGAGSWTLSELIIVRRALEKLPE